MVFSVSAGVALSLFSFGFVSALAFCFVFLMKREKSLKPLWDSSSEVFVRYLQKQNHLLSFGSHSLSPFLWLSAEGVDGFAFLERVMGLRKSY